ncbi:hypothetical protein L7F22_017711 [Adiantum nelumboides]|nr:hypothetical protein [Adiantum nelumboides]
MFPTLKEKVEAKFPQTFEKAQEIATVKFKKLLYQERKSNCVKEREEVNVPQHTNNAQPRVASISADSHQEDLLHKLTQQLETLTLNLVQAPTRGQQLRDDARPLTRSTEELRCWSCNETDHGMYHCPHPRRIPGDMYPPRRPPQTVQIDVPQQPPTILRKPPPPPQPMAAMPPVPEKPEERGVNIIKLEEPEELNVMPALKRTRAQEKDEEMKSDTSDEPKKGKKKVKEDEAESSKKKKSRRPRRKWGIDAIGPLPRTSTGKQYILTATDYMTRWAEAASVARITATDVSKFVLDYICSRFGTPLEILSDRGPGFRADLLDALLENLSIKHVHSTPYYPQCNGLVEKTNGVLCKIITKHVRDRPQDWDKHLTAALWDYRTSFKVSTQFTPYHLVYGQEALLPIGNLRVLARETTSSKEKLEQRIRDLQRLELDREAATDYYITQANKKREEFNNKVKEKKLEEGKLVMSYDSRLDLSHSKKFLQRWEGPYVIFKKFKNGSYRLQDISGKIHKYPINGWRLKEFFQHIQPIQEERQVSLDA